MYWEGARVMINERSATKSHDETSDGLTLWRAVIVEPGRHVRGPEMVLSESSEVTAGDTSSVKRKANVAVSEESE